MSNTFKRLTLAACLSISGIVGTLIWERLTAEKSGSQSVGEPVAQLMSAVRDVERKPSQRLIWERISEGSQLFAGETIRTSKDSEAHVEFIRSKTRIDLDPDSEIVIQEVDGKIELNFLKGNLFVASTGTGAAGGGDLTLKSGDKNIALGGSELTLSQNGKGKLDVTVLKGDASLGSSAQIKILSPAPNDSVYIVPKDKTPVTFVFEPIPAGYRLVLEAGKSRDEMKPIDVDASAAGRVQAAMKLGRVYWRLVAKPVQAGQPELASAVYKVNVLAKTPVVLLSPERDEVLALSDYGVDGVPLSWSNPARLEKLRVEIFRGKDLTKPFATEEASDDEVFIKLTEPGEYSWRVTGHLPGKDEEVIGSMRAFRAIARKELTVPSLVSPRMDEIVPFQSFTEKGLEMRWKPVDGAVGYKVSVKNRKTNETIDKEAASPLFVLRDLKPGDYAWSVQALGAKGEESKFSAVNNFGLADLLELRWADGKADVEQKYFTASPSVDLVWEKGPDYAVKYRTRVKTERDIAAAAVDSDWTTTEKVSVSKSVSADGVYLAEVEALDAKGRVVARTLRRRVSVTAEPLLPAPAFDASLGKEVVASGSGNARFAWAPVEGAKEYEIAYDGRGKLNEVRLPETQKNFTKLMPGKYTVTVRAIDSHGRRSPASAPKVMTVPDKSDVKAPKLKKFRFE